MPQQREESVPVNNPAPVQQKSSASGLFIRVPSENSAEYKKAMDFLAVFEGLTPLYINFADTKKSVSTLNHFGIEINEELLANLKEMLDSFNCN